MEPDDLLCSRNARPEKALVGRAQWKINQPPSLRDHERAWRDHLYRSTRAIEDRPGYPVKRKTSELGRGVARQLAWSLCSQSPHDEAVVARCAQWRPHQPPRWIRVKSWEIARSMRAVKGSLGYFLKEKYREKVNTCTG